MKKLATFTALLILSGCSADMGSPQEEDTWSHGLGSGSEKGATSQSQQVFSEDGEILAPVAEVQVGETTVSFYVDAEGTTVFANGPVGEVQGIMNPLGSGDTVELYETLSGKQAPAALVEALKAEELVAPSPGEDEQQDSFESDGLVQSLPDSSDNAEYAKIYSHSSWVKNFCDWTSHFKAEVCLTNVHCTGSNCTILESKSHRSLAYVNALGSNPVQTRILRRNTWGNYKERARMTVDTGQVLAIFDSTATYTHNRKIQVFNSQDRDFHIWTGTWNNNMIFLYAFPDQEF